MAIRNITAANGAPFARPADSAPNRRLFVKMAVCAVLAVAISAVQWYIIHRAGADARPGGSLADLLQAAAFAALTFYALRSRAAFAAFAALLLTWAAAFAVADAALSPIDEGAHEAYIQFLVEQGRLPTFYDGPVVWYDPAVGQIGSNGSPYYEAVQPPLYYALSALLFGWIGDLRLRLIAMRLWGLVCLAVAAAFTLRAAAALQRVSGGLRDDAHLRLAMLLFFSPAVLMRFSRLSNDTLLAPLCAFAVWQTARLLASGYKPSGMYLLGGVCGLAVLTKNTGAAVCVLPAAVALYYKKPAGLAAAAPLAALPVLPWLAWNVRTYGALTAMEYHVAFVLPIVAPDGVMPDWLGCFAQQFWPTFWLAQECTASPVLCVVGDFFAVSFTLLLGRWAQQAVRFLRGKGRRLRFSCQAAERAAMIRTAMTAAVLGSMLLLAAGCVATGIPGLLGRYLHSMLPALVLLLLPALERLPCRFDRLWTRLSCFFFGLLLACLAQTCSGALFPP